VSLPKEGIYGTSSIIPVFQIDFAAIPPVHKRKEKKKNSTFYVKKQGCAV